jgi:hypothetical protein
MADAHDKQIEMIKQLAAESERIKTSSGEYLWICKGTMPPKIPDLPQPKGETNPLRRAAKGETAEATQYRRPDGTIGDLAELKGVANEN